MTIGNSRPLAPWIGHDAHRVVVGLGQHGLDDPRAFGALQRRPTRGSRAACRRRASPNGARLVDDEADAPRDVAEAAAVDADLEHVPLAHDALEQLARRRATCARRAAARGTASRRATGWSAGSDSGSGRVMSQRPPCSTWNVKRSSSPQPNSGERSALDERELVARVVDRAQRHRAGRGPRGCRRRASSSRRGTGCPASSSACSRKPSDVRAGSRMQMSPSRASRHPSSPSRDLPALVDRGARPRRRRRRLRASRGARPSGSSLVRLDAEQHHAPGPRRRRRASRSSARYSGCEPGTGWMSSPNTWLIHASTGSVGAEVAREQQRRGRRSVSRAARKVRDVGPPEPVDRLLGSPTKNRRPGSTVASRSTARRRASGRRSASSAASSTWIGSVSWNSSMSRRW